MLIEEPDPLIVCNRCEEQSTDSEVSARAEGWAIDRDVEPNVHLCPDCQEGL